MDHYPQMISPEPEHHWAKVMTPHIRFKFLRKTSFKGRHMKLGSFINGSADEHGERRSSAKLTYKDNISTWRGRRAGGLGLPRGVSKIITREKVRWKNLAENFVPDSGLLKTQDFTGKIAICIRLDIDLHTAVKHVDEKPGDQETMVIDLQLGIEIYQAKTPGNLDQMVKDFHLFEYNKGMETRKWSEDDKRRSKDFITAIEKRLQIRRIYRSLESFVGGRIRDIDYTLINRTT
ncbi:hypothetical protein Tco_0488678 [Tanacetum coccineum]